MAKGKKSFILYADLISIVKKLVEQDRENKTNYAGELFLHVLEYVNDTNPVPINFIVDMAFEPIKLQLKRDLKKWEHTSIKRSEIGHYGGIKSGEARRSKTKQTNQLVQSRTKTNQNEHDTVNVNDNDNVTVNVKEIKINIPDFMIFRDYVMSKIDSTEYYKIQRALKLKYDAWVENGWRDGNDKSIKNWRSKILNTIPYLNNGHNGNKPHSKDTGTKTTGFDSDKAIEFANTRSFPGSE